MKLASILLFTAAAFAQKLTGPIPVTADSSPFLAAGRNLQPLDLAKLGYVEEEFIISGAANIYDLSPDGALHVKTANAPYATRILVRRPADPARFNGTAVVELMNTARRFDWPMMWGYIHNYVTDQGAAWIGVTMPGAIQSLKKFNQTRYAALSFANPAPGETCAAGGGGAPPSDIEDGLRWDMISQVGTALKNGSAGFRAQRVYLTAQGGDAVAYAQAIQPQAKVYDAFVIKSLGNAGRLSRCSAALPAENYLKNVGVPVIGVLGQGEVVAEQAHRRPDSDDANDKFRLYEVAGAAHIDSAAYVSFASFAEQAATGNTPQGTPSWPFNVRCEPEILLQELPLLSYVFDAAFTHLDAWLQKGTPAPHAPRIMLNAGAVALDDHGNGTGGIRSPYVDVPTATYFTTNAGQGTCRELGREAPFRWAQLDAMYGSYKNYSAKIAESIDRMAKERWLTPGDAKRIREELLTPQAKAHR